MAFGRKAMKTVAMKSKKKVAMKAVVRSKGSKSVRMSAKNSATTSARSSSQRASRSPCLKILAQLQALSITPKGEIRVLVSQATKAAKSKQKEEACNLLGRVLARVGAALEADVCQAEAARDKLAEEHRLVTVEQTLAEQIVNNSKQAMVDSKAELNDAAQAISSETKALSLANAEKKHLATGAQKTDDQVRCLKEVEQNAFQPLKDSQLEGSEARKQIKSLCGIGHKIGLDEDLLNIVPGVLQKDFERRQTFDKYVVQSLDTELAKRVSALCSKQQENEHALEERSQVLERRQEALTRAREKREQCLGKLSRAKAAHDAGREAVADARKRLGGLKTRLTKASKCLTQARTRHDGLRQGPLAAYLKLLREADQAP